jgi:uncharacterized membrane protein
LKDRYVIQQLKFLDSKMDSIIRELKFQGKTIQDIFNIHLGTPNIKLDSLALLELPKPEQKTMMALMEIGKGQANDVARITRRSRCTESHILVRLEQEAHLIVSEPNGNRIFYSLKAKE